MHRMEVLKVAKRWPIVFPLAMVVAIAMVLISEAAYWRSVGTLNEITAIDGARTHLQGLRQGILAAQAGQRSYLLNQRPEYLRAYRLALQDVETSFATLQQRYQGTQAYTQVLSELRAVTDTLLSELTTTLEQQQQGARVN
ncbi:MAG: hypothetical protein CFE44_06550 [Burkholderiales bacterium PBB4]|nr:MAG: hypothetical protein CFE44_06550 [Burkholderiales bacterium PBB4]